MPRVATMLDRVRRGSLWQILGSYAVGSWLVLQLAETLSSLLGLPLWFGTGVVVLLLAGAPLVLLTTLLQGRGEDEASLDASPGSFRMRRFFTWRNALRTGGLVVLLFTLTTVGYLGLRQTAVEPFGTLQAKGIIGFEERIILAEFENRSTDPTLGEAVTALLRVDLAQSSAIAVLEPEQLAPILQRMERPTDTRISTDVALEMAEREGIKAIVAGEILPLGDGYVLSTRLLSVADRNSLVAERETAADISDIPRAVDALSARLRERIGESLRTIQSDPPLEDVTTASLEALRLYVQGLRANDAGDYQTAASILEQALSADPNFAMAHRKLGIILSNANVEPERATEAFRRAYDRRDRLTERERYLAEAAYHTYVAADEQAAVASYEALLARYPADGVALNNLGILLQGQGRLVEAADLYERAIELRTGTRATYGNALFLFSWLGRPDRVDVAFEEFEEMFPGHPAVLSAGASLASSRFDYERATSYATQLRDTRRGDPVWESAALFELGSLALVGGRVDSGVDLLVEGVEITQGRLPFMSVPVSLFRAEMEAQATLVFGDDPDGAVLLLDRAVDSEVFDTTSGDRGLLRFADLYARAGGVEQARALIAEYEETLGGPPPSGSFDAVTMALARGSIAKSEGRFTDAVTHFRSEPAGWMACPLCGLWELGATYELAGQPDSALAAYERYLASDVLYRISTDATNLWRTLLATGRLYEEHGRLEDARSAYARFVDLWADADPDVEPRVQEARAAVERLSRAIGGR